MRHNTADFLDETGSISMLDAPFGAYEKAILRSMVLSLLAARINNGRVRLSEEFLAWYARFATVTGLNFPAVDKLAKRAVEDRLSISKPTIRLSRKAVLEQNAFNPERSALQKRLDWVAATLKLETREALALAAVCRLTQLGPFRGLAQALAEYGEERDEVSARVAGTVIGLHGRRLHNIFDRQGQLMQLGLLEDRHGGDFAPSEMLLKLLRQRTTDPRVLEDALIGGPVVSRLSLADFDHLGQARDDVVAILSGCMKQRAEGVGLLFYGPPGTGKTEFATLLGEACKARVVFAGEIGREHREPERADRLAHLSLLSAIGRRAGRVIVVVDEADDIFTGVDDDEYSNRSGSKVFINRLVESCPVPTIWITNHPERLGPAVQRRMLRAVEFRKPGADVRRAIINRHLSDLDLDIDAGSRARLAKIDAAPAVIASGLRAASLGCGGGQMAISSVLSIQRAMGRPEPVPPLPQHVGFDAALSSADMNLVDLEEKVAAAGPSALSFLFTGVPGTGKSAYARHLAARLELDVLQKRGSDLLDKYVGQTEANIAQAFEEAADCRKFLIFDEADTLLSDRRHAHRNWEVGQVNEMLTWMENHPMPFAATSNLLDRLDPAVQRRFLIKVRFAAMTADQIDLAFRRYFSCVAPKSLLRLDMVTPGDFAVVARKCKVLGQDNADILANMIAAEVALKPGANRTIGFL